MGEYADLPRTKFPIHLESTSLSVGSAEGPSDPPRKTQPKRVGNFGLRGSVCARLAGMFAVNVTQVMTSSKGLKIEA